MKRILSIGKDDFYPQIFRLAVPIIIQNLLSAAVNSADVIMLNYVGQSWIMMKLRWNTKGTHGG